MGRRKGKKNRQRQKAYKQHSNNNSGGHQQKYARAGPTPVNPGQRRDKKRPGRKGPELVNQIALEVFGNLYFCVGDDNK